MNELPECFGANLARCRRRLRLSQEDVAHRASLHRTEVSGLERGLRLPRLDTAVKLAAAVEAELGELVAGISWACGDYRAGAFVPDGQSQPPPGRATSRRNR
ncbi:MAG TPA: helix-turn-helix transcriptional regulator [Dehalococcoidia bacterium]|nr:helix-turn-helix transcriptional regulator [Dehalococcoidia bacterium]